MSVFNTTANFKFENLIKSGLKGFTKNLLGFMLIMFCELLHAFACPFTATYFLLRVVLSSNSAPTQHFKSSYFSMVWTKYL